MNPSFWKNKKVLITGHTGFKGSWLSHLLDHLGAQVYGLAQPPETSPSMFEVTKVENFVKHHIADICQQEILANKCRDIAPDIIFHFAAQALVRRSYAEPHLTTMTNVMGTVNVLEALKDLSTVKSAIFITTDKVYKNHEWVWPYRESDALGGHDPYSASKACSDIMVQSYGASFFNSGLHDYPKIPLAIARAGNVIGGGDWSADRLIPDIMRAIKNSETLTIRNPGSVRPWQHVLEPLVGYLNLAEHAATTSQSTANEVSTYNFGPEVKDCQPVGTIVSWAKEYFGSSLDVELNSSNTAPHEAGLLKLECSQARSNLGWTPKWDLGEALSMTFEWYRTFQEGQATAEITRNQIIRYLGEEA